MSCTGINNSIPANLRPTTDANIATKMAKIP